MPPTSLISRCRLLAVVVFGSALVVPLLVTLALTSTETAGSKEQRTAHRIVFQVNSDDPTIMKHAITNSLNATRSYKDKNEPVAIEIVAYGSGVHMFRADTSPVKDLLQLLRASNADVVFSICGSTKMIMEGKDGRSMPLVEGVQVVPFGIVRLVELQEAGWSYVRP